MGVTESKDESDISIGIIYKHKRGIQIGILNLLPHSNILFLIGRIKGNGQSESLYAVCAKAEDFNLQTPLQLSE